MKALPLVWRQPTDHPDDHEETSILIADGIGGRYHITADRVDGYLLWLPSDAFTFVPFDTIEKAQAWAESEWQMEYDRRAG